MTYDNFTIKAQEAILKAQKIGGALDHQGIDTPHLIRGMMEIDENVLSFLLQRVCYNPSIPKIAL